MRHRRGAIVSSNMRGEVARCNGTEVTTSGDGFFARFDSPAHAVEAARAAREAMTALDPLSTQSAPLR